MTRGQKSDSAYEGRDRHFVDVDRMVNEGLAGGLVTLQNGRIESTTTDTMDDEDEAMTREKG